MGRDGSGARFGARAVLIVTAAVAIAGWPVAGIAQPAAAAAAAADPVVPGIAELGVVMQRAKALDEAGDHKRAERLWREALRQRIALLGADSPDLAPAYDRLAGALEAQGRWPAAEAPRARAVALLGAARTIDGSALGRALSRQAHNFLQQRRMAEAATASRAALAVLRKEGDRTVDAAWGYGGVGAVLAAQDRLAEAEPYYRLAADIRRAQLGEGDGDTATSLNNLGVLLGRLGRVDEAVPLLAQAFKARAAINPVGDPAAETASNMGITLDANGRSAEATIWLQKAAAIWRARGGAGGTDAAAADTALAMNLVHLGRAAEAEPLLRRALAIQRAKAGDRAAATGTAWAALAATLDALGRHRAALAAHDRGLATRQATAGVLAVADRRFNRAACYRAGAQGRCGGGLPDGAGAVPGRTGGGECAGARGGTGAGRSFELTRRRSIPVYAGVEHGKREAVMIPPDPQRAPDGRGMAASGLSIADWDPADPDPWLALMMDRTLPIDPEAKAALLRDQRSRSRQFLLPLVRPFARLSIVAAQIVHMVSPRWPHAPRLLHRMIAWGMRHLLTPDANRLILRHFHLGAQILRFIADNATPGFRPDLWPMEPRRIDDVRDDLFLRHDLNIYNFLIALNAEMDRRGTRIARVATPDFSAISDMVTLEPLPRGRWNVIDLQTAIECYTPAYAMLLTDRDFWRATNSLQLDETIGLYVARLTGEEKHLAMVANHHPMVPHSTLRAGFRLVLHGLSTELLHGFLRELKAQAEKGGAVRAGRP